MNADTTTIAPVMNKMIYGAGRKKMSPYQSKSQMRYMHAVKPKIAAEWDSKYGVPKNLPEKKNKYREATMKK